MPTYSWNPYYYQAGWQEWWGDQRRSAPCRADQLAKSGPPTLRKSQREAQTSDPVRKGWRKSLDKRSWGWKRQSRCKTGLCVHISGGLCQRWRSDLALCGSKEAIRRGTFSQTNYCEQLVDTRKSALDKAQKICLVLNIWVLKQGEM